MSQTKKRSSNPKTERTKKSSPKAEKTKKTQAKRGRGPVSQPSARVATKRPKVSPEIGGQSGDKKIASAVELKNSSIVDLVSSNKVDTSSSADVVVKPTWANLALERIMGILDIVPSSS